MKRIITIVVIFLAFLSIFIMIDSAEDYPLNDYQKKFAKMIIMEAYRAKKITGLPASIFASQCILETGWGKYIPTDMHTGKFSYNLFGIKGSASNGFVEIYTHEYVNGKRIRIKAKFRAYNSYAESFIDYGNLILKSERYALAVVFRNYPRRYIYELWKAGYATDINYPQKVLKIAEQMGWIKKDEKRGKMD